MQISDDELKAKLTPEEFHILRESGTEAPFTGVYWDNHANGTYRCKVCHSLLFDSTHKFDSGSGWPSFDQPAEAHAVATRDDSSHGMTRTEVYCPVCNSHLGHVFPDGPSQTTGLRYCINSAALEFDAKDGMNPIEAQDGSVA